MLTNKRRREESLIIKDLAVAPNGDIWTVNSSYIDRCRKKKWQRFPITKRGSDYFEDIEVAADGQVVVTHDRRRLRFDGKKSWTEEEIAAREYNGMEGSAEVIETLGGVTWAVLKPGYVAEDRRVKLRIQPPGGGKPHTIPLPAEPRIIKVDAQGRSWLALRTGIRVVGYGTPAIDIPVDTVEPLAALMMDIVIVGAGPSLPSPGPGLVIPALSATVHYKSKPVANASVAMCLEARSIFVKRDKPCQDEKPWRTKTDASGKFERTDFPLGIYDILVEYGDDWHSVESACCPELTPGKKLDLGIRDIGAW